jgi:flagellar motility protein MotE (MotC chaperone)
MSLGIALIVALVMLDCGHAKSVANQQIKKMDPVGPDLPPDAEGRDIQHYCSSIAAAADSARISRQEARLRELEEQVRRRGNELEGKQRELRQLVDKYEIFIHRADEALVKIYARMKPDAAAAHLASIDEEMAAALLFQLNPKISGAILNEITASRGATLIKKIASFSSLSRSGKQP